MPVLDASVLVEYVVGGERSEAVSERLMDAKTALWAPHLADAEVGHVLRRAELAGEISQTRARAALADLRDLPLRRAPHVSLLERAWALRANLSFYDGLYVALAEALELPLLTLDARLQRAAGTRARIEVVL
jgi:predicted nucleic acid-binding protein